jgi:hypothetical protein
MSTIGIVNFDTPCYLISGLGKDFFVYVSIVRLGGPPQLILLSPTHFTEVDGHCNAIHVSPAIVPPPPPQVFVPRSGLNIPSDGWGIVQRTPKVEGLTISLSDAAKDINVNFYPIVPPVDFVDPTQGLIIPGPLELPPEAKIFINGGSIWNGIENSVINFFYTQDGGVVIPSGAIPFGQGSRVLTNATIPGIFIREPPTAQTPRMEYWPVSPVKEEEGMSAVVMKKPVGPPDGNLGEPEYYLASMVEEGAIPMTNLTNILEG